MFSTKKNKLTQPTQPFLKTFENKVENNKVNKIKPLKI
jgi:hypothetical protein